MDPLHAPSSRKDREINFLRPNPRLAKYIGRDVEVGRIEAAKRLSWIPTVIRRSGFICESLDVVPPLVLPAGSSILLKCTPQSDLDLAIVVPPEHAFNGNTNNSWCRYSDQLMDAFDERILRVRPWHTIVEQSVYDIVAKLSPVATPEDASAYVEVLARLQLK